MKTEKILVIAALAGIGWWFYTRSKGLTLTGGDAHQMLPPEDVNKQSLVTPSVSTGLGFTNVFNAISGTISQLVGSLTAKAGNAPNVASASSTIPAGHVSSGAQQVKPGQPAPFTAAQPPSLAGTLNQKVPFWSWMYPSPLLFQAVPPAAPSVDFSNTARYNGPITFG